MIRIASLALALSVLVVSADAQVIRATRALPQVPGSPQQIFSGDFGGDAAPDLLVFDSTGTLSVLINQPAGFAEPVNTTLTTTPWSLAVADFNGDGHPDVAVSLLGTDQVRLYLADGAGGFTVAATLATVDAPGYMAAGDFNGDGKMDVAVAHMYNDQNLIAVHFGDGAGSLGAAIPTTLPHFLNLLQAADLNGDGRTDLLSYDYQSVSLLSDGAGHFTAQYIPGSSGGPICIGDFNGDGKMDYARAGETHEEDIEIRLGNGNGTFIAAGIYPALYGNGVIRCADIDGDHDLDILAGAGYGGLSVLKGNGQGQFSAPTMYATDRIQDFVYGDFDRDTIPDLAIAVQYFETNPDLVLLKGFSGGRFDVDRLFLPYPVVPVQYPGASPAYVRAADFNGDHKPDVATIVRAGTERRLSILLNNGDGTVGAPVYTTFNLGVSADDLKAAYGDLNGDGRSDVVIAYYSYASGYQALVLLGRGDGTFDALASFSRNDGTPMLEDLTNDGVLDLVLDTDSWDRPSSLYRGNGDGTFGAATTFTALFDVAADLNGDGFKDLIGADSYAININLNNQGNGTFVTTSLAEKDVWAPAIVTDLNADGKQDVIVTNYDGRMHVRLGNGDGTFGAFREIMADGFSSKLYAGDFDGDGNVDLAKRSGIVLGDGQGTFRGAIEHRLLEDVMDVADFDGNGSPDLLTSSHGHVGVLLTRVAPAPTVATTLALSKNLPSPQYAQAVTFVATLNPSVVTRSGSIAFTRDGVAFAVKSIVNGTASAAVAFAVGAHTVRAYYAADDYHQAAEATMAFDVPKATTSVYAAPYWTPSYCDTVVQIKAALVAATDPSLSPSSGPLTFRIGSTPVEAVRYQGAYYLYDLDVGTHTITAEYAGDANYLPSSTTFELVIVNRYPVRITAGSGAFADSEENYASTPSVVAPLQWSITNGTILSGQGSTRIRYRAGSSGVVTITATADSGSCTNTETVTVPIVPRSTGASMFYVISPCRVLDTRSGTILAKNSTRDIPVGGLCGVPQDALSVAANVTTVTPTFSGWLSIYPRGTAWPGTSTVSYRAQKSRATSTILRLGTAGNVQVRNSESDVHLLIDVYGYFK